jgi:periplasmic copper chaperone A
MTSIMNRIKLSLVLGGLALAAQVATAQTTVKEAWVRATVAQQKASGAFMQITSSQGGALIGVQSPVAANAEIHEMAMAGDVMQMRAVPRVELPAGKAVQLKPGGFHVMLLDLKQPIKVGDSVPLTLVIEAKDGKRETLHVKASVKALGAHDAKH